MLAAAFAVGTQRQGSPFCHEGNLSKGDLGGVGGVKVEVELVLRSQAARQSRSSVVVLQVQVHTLYLSCRHSPRRIE